MKWIPEIVLAEREKLFKEAFDSTPDDCSGDELIRAYHELIEQFGSPELKAFEVYSSRFGDEGELLEKDGSYLLSKKGTCIQDWYNTEDGFLRDKDGNKVFYKDGTPVPNIEMPEIIQRLYDEEDGL